MHWINPVFLNYVALLELVLYPEVFCKGRKTADYCGQFVPQWVSVTNPSQVVSACSKAVEVTIRSKSMKGKVFILNSPRREIMHLIETQFHVGTRSFRTSTARESS
jgi:hypothetical protein